LLSCEVAESSQIVYLVVLTAGEHKPIPTLSLILIAAIYGLQAFVFIMRRKWDMVGWMVFYILAIPAFSFFLPLYSFWRMDDFSWGQTRIVMGEAGKKMIVHVRISLLLERNRSSRFVLGRRQVRSALDSAEVLERLREWGFHVNSVAS
jgi:Chitin synthase